MISGERRTAGGVREVEMVPHLCDAVFRDDGVRSVPGSSSRARVLHRVSNL